MNIGIYSMRDDEADYVRQMEESLGIHILTTSEDPSVDNADFLGGCEGVSGRSSSAENYWMHGR